MKIEWIHDNERELELKSLLKEKGFSKKLLAKIKFQGGMMEVNQTEVTVRARVQKGDRVCVTLPPEEGNDYLTPDHTPIDVLYEDPHVLLIDKPVGVISVPSPAHKEGTMANRVKGYIQRMGYEHQGVHVVTRLDRDTSGVMLFAKHSMAHSLLDVQLRAKQIRKMYAALLEGVWTGEAHGLLDMPIARSEESIILRRVAPGGKPALTEYWVKERFPDATLMDVQLHTGRTHQIRVHFSHLGYPLVGDDLYGDPDAVRFGRQALHCASVSFMHPFYDKLLQVSSPLPSDIQQLLRAQQVITR